MTNKKRNWSRCGAALAKRRQGKKGEGLINKNLAKQKQRNYQPRWER